MIEPQLVIMSKAPLMGRVKTRLAGSIGAVEATRFFRHTSLQAINRLGRDPRWSLVLALSPDRAVHDEGHWPTGLPRIAQGSGDLGDRMRRLMCDLPPGPVVMIGGDIPGIKARHIATAFRALGRSDAVFGPAEDGGYWLVGLKRMPRVPQIFDNVRWSSPHALADTLANVSRADLKVEVLETLPDIDTGEDYARWRAASR
ncbi:MAG: TIGR04282 family arsenosugar biosynthesis glycosyltransferase [Parvibaculum sp.]